METKKKSHRAGKKRISFDMSEDDYKVMKKAADDRGLTITYYIIQSIGRRLMQETYNIKD